MAVTKKSLISNSTSKKSSKKAAKKPAASPVAAKLATAKMINARNLTASRLY